MTTTTATTKTKASKNGNSQPPVLLAGGVQPVLDVMKKAAAVLKVPVPSGKGDAVVRELLGALRMRIAELNEPIPPSNQLECEQCGERSTEDTEYCPFCGDMGIAPDDAVPKAAANASTISKLPEVSPGRDVDGGMVNLEQELKKALDAFTELKKRFVSTTYEMGEICKDIHERQLYKAKGYDSFKQFADAGELPVKRTAAYALIKVVEQFSREQYNQLGFAKMRTIGLLESDLEREEMVSEVKAKGTTLREVDAKVKERRRAEAPEAAAEQPAPPPPPKQNGKVTLLTKLDGKPRELRFKSAKSGLPLGSAGKVTQYDKHAYAEVELDGGVYLRIGLRVSGRDLVGLSAEFRRVEDDDAAAAQ